MNRTEPNRTDLFERVDEDAAPLDGVFLALEVVRGCGVSDGDRRRKHHWSVSGGGGGGAAQSQPGGARRRRDGHYRERTVGGRPRARTLAAVSCRCRCRTLARAASRHVAHPRGASRFYPLQLVFGARASQPFIYTTLGFVCRLCSCARQSRRYMATRTPYCRIEAATRGARVRDASISVGSARRTIYRLTRWRTPPASRSLSVVRASIIAPSRAISCVINAVNLRTASRSIRAGITVFFFLLSISFVRVTSVVCESVILFFYLQQSDCFVVSLLGDVIVQFCEKIRHNVGGVCGGWAVERANVCSQLVPLLIRRRWIVCRMRRYRNKLLMIV